MPLKTLLILALLSPATMLRGESAVTWKKDLDAARVTAEREKKLMLVHFHSTHCGPCRMLEATVFNQPTVAGVVHSNYVPVKINTDEYPATAERFGIERVPCDVVITSDGKLVARKISPASPMDYVKFVSGVADEHRRVTGRTFPTVASRPGTTQPVNSAYASLAVPGDQNSFTQPPVEPTTPGVMANPHATMPTAPPVAPPANTVAQPATNPAFPPIEVPNPYANLPGIGETPQPSSPAQVAASVPAITPEIPAQAPQPAVPAVQPTAQVAKAGPQLPPGAPPLGLSGFCPVTLTKEGKWQKGDARWGCYHRGRTYLFATMQARDEFQKQGDKYAPALSGIDPVAAIDTGKVVPGSPQFCLDCDGQIYLFSSDENLKKFSGQASRYVTGIRQAMSAAPTGRTLR